VSYLLHPRVALLALAIAGPACGGTDFGPAPTISDLTIQTPLASDATRVTGTVHVTDPAGLTTLVASLTVTSAGSSITLPPLIMNGPVEGQVEANVSFRIKRPTEFPAGAYEVAVQMIEDGVPSNSLSTTMTVE
jgi:hypothetical protein